MAYQQGNLIDAADYNQIREDVGEVFNDRNAGIFPFVEASSSYGYGVPHISSSVAVSDTITAEQWDQLFEEIYRCAVHQGTSTGNIPEPADSPFSGSGAPDSGDLIEAYDGSSGLLQLVSDIRNNKLVFSPGYFSVTSGGSMETSTRTTAWSDVIEHEFYFNLSDIENVRYFFNSGGQILFSGSRSGGSSNSQNTAWTDAFDEMNDVMFGATQTTTNGDGQTFSVGLYDLTTSDQMIYSKEVIAGDEYYGGSDRIEIFARLDNDFETNARVRFTVRLSPNNTQFEGNTIDGDLNSWIDKREADTYVPPPESLSDADFTNVTALSSGG